MENKQKDKLSIGLWQFGLFFFFVILIYNIWSGKEIVTPPMRICFYWLGICLFCSTFDHVVPFFLGDITAKWKLAVGYLLGASFCLFVFYTCDKGISDNTMVFYNEYGKMYHVDKYCEDLDYEKTVMQCRRVEADKNGLKPCTCCEAEFYED